MRSAILAAFFVSSASLAAAEDKYWWSYRGNGTSDFGYDPTFEVCGSSCEDCREDARRCHADDFSNICYEPAAGETCCKDVYGTACLPEFYCAYNSEAIAFCCADDTDVEDCGNIFEETLTKSERAEPTTVVVTEMFRPSTAASDSVVARPNHTRPPQVLDTESNNGKKSGSSSMSLGSKIGIAIGAFVGATAVVGLLAFWFLRRRRNAKYSHVGGTPGNHLTAQHPSPFDVHSAPAPIHGANTAYEPMRTQPPPEYYQSEYKAAYMTSPPLSTTGPHYANHPVHGAPPHQGMELHSMPPVELADNRDQVHEISDQNNRR